MRITGELTVNDIVKLVRKHLPKGVPHSVIIEKDQITIKVTQKNNSTNEAKRYVEELYSTETQAKQGGKQKTKATQGNKNAREMQEKHNETTQQVEGKATKLKKPTKFQIVTSLLNREEDVFYEEDFSDADVEEKSDSLYKEDNIEYMIDRIGASIYKAIMSEGKEAAKARMAERPDYIRVEIYEKGGEKLAEFEKDVWLKFASETLDKVTICKIIDKSGVLEELQEKGIL